MGGNVKLILRRGKEQSLKRFHPWVFSGAIERVVGEPENGEVVKVYSGDREFLAVGHYQKGSIMVRVLSFTEREIDAAFWRESIGNALAARKALGLVGNPATTCYRLVHGEGDFLPGLIIDIYGTVAVVQTHSAGMHAVRGNIAEALQELYGPSLTAIYSKSTSLAEYEGENSYLYRSSEPVSAGSISGGSISGYCGEVLENGCRFHVDWEKGQKTGFFLDQRENRELVRRYAAGKDVLNLFCYTGGFSVYAMAGGAKGVVSVDSSGYAAEAAAENLRLNGFSGECVCTDAIEYLRDLEGDRFDLMIVDPPAFAKHLSAKQNALRAYKKLNALAIEKVRRGGLIFTFSCSQVVDKFDFVLAVFSAAALAGRKVRIIHRLTQPADHPVNIYHPEGEYLKGLVLYVE